MNISLQGSLFDNKPFGTEEKARSFVICSECRKKHGLPNPYETYTGITDQKAQYEKRLDNYGDSDLVNDKDDYPPPPSGSKSKRRFAR